MAITVLLIVSYPDKWVMSDVTLQDSVVGELRRITRVSQSHVLCQPPVEETSQLLFDVTLLQ